MKIAVLGGTFNPPHLGHLLIARQLLDFGLSQEVWLTPCWRHTFQKNFVAAKHRIAMTKFLVKDKIKYCNQEIKNKLDGQTIKLMTLLKKKYSDHHFYFVIGSDNLKNFKKWGNWQKLITSFDFLVFPRPNFDYNLKKYGLEKKEYRFHLIKHPLLITSNISSTTIRKRIKKKMSIDYLVPYKVKQYIEKNRLYFGK